MRSNQFLPTIAQQQIRPSQLGKWDPNIVKERFSQNTAGPCRPAKLKNVGCNQNNIIPASPPVIGEEDLPAEWRKRKHL